MTGSFYFVYSYTLLRFLTKYDNYIVCFKSKQQMNFLVSQYAKEPTVYVNFCL